MSVTGNRAWKQGQEGVLELKGGWLEWQTVVVVGGLFILKTEWVPVFISTNWGVSSTRKWRFQLLGSTSVCVKLQVSFVTQESH